MCHIAGKASRLIKHALVCSTVPVIKTVLACSVRICNYVANYDEDCLSMLFAHRKYVTAGSFDRRCLDLTLLSKNHLRLSIGLCMVHWFLRLACKVSFFS